MSIAYLQLILIIAFDKRFLLLSDMETLLLKQHYTLTAVLLSSLFSLTYSLIRCVLVVIWLYILNIFNCTVECCKCVNSYMFIVYRTLPGVS